MEETAGSIRPRRVHDGLMGVRLGNPSAAAGALPSTLPMPPRLVLQIEAFALLRMSLLLGGATARAASRSAG